MHPGEHRDGHVLALVSRPECEDDVLRRHGSVRKDLMLTTDFGQTEGEI